MVSPNNWQFAYHRANLDLLWKGDLTALRNLRTPVGPDEEQRHALERFDAKVRLRQYDEARRLVAADPRDTIDIYPKSFLLGEVYAREGDSEHAALYVGQALPLLEQAVQQKPDDPDKHLTLGHAYAYVGRQADAIAEAKRAAELMPESKDAWSGEVVLCDVAKVYAVAGAADLALALLAHLLDEPSELHAQAVAIDPVWDAIRHDLRFQKLLAEHGVRLR